MAEEQQQQAPDTEAPAAEDEFAKSFSARAAEMRGQQPAEPDEKSGSDTQEGADAPSDDKAGEAEAEGEAKDAKPDSEAEPAKPAEKAKEPDLWEGLTPEQEAYFRRVAQSERSQRGRVGALTKQLQSNRAAPKEPQKTEAKDQADAKDSIENLEAEVKKAAEDYPEAAGPLAKMIEQVKRQVDEVASTVKPIADQRTEAELTRAYETLGEKHPDYMDFIEGDKREKLVDWVQTQRPGIQRLLGSHDPEDVSLGLTLFKAETGTEQQPAEEDPKSEKTETDAKRKRQLEGSKDTPDKGVPAASGAPDDFGAAFKARSEELKRKRALA